MILPFYLEKTLKQNELLLRQNLLNAISLISQFYVLIRAMRIFCPTSFLKRWLHDCEVYY